MPISDYVAPLRKHAVCPDFTQLLFFYDKRFPKKLADDRCSSRTKDTIDHSKQVYVQPLTTVVDWQEIWFLIANAKYI